jgi:hypothetical protein
MTYNDISELFRANAVDEKPDRARYLRLSFIEVKVRSGDYTIFAKNQLLQSCETDQEFDQLSACRPAVPARGLSN